MKLFSRLWSLVMRPPAPPPFVHRDPTPQIDIDGRPYYLARNGRRLYFSWEGQRRLTYWIARSNKFPPRGSCAYLNTEGWGIFDRETGERHRVAEESVRGFKDALKRLWRARLEMTPAPTEVSYGER